MMPDSRDVAPARIGSAGPPVAAQEKELSAATAPVLRDVLSWLKAGWRRIVGAAAMAGLVAAGAAWLLPDIYTARVSVLPPNSTQPGGSAAALAALGALGGLPGGFASKTPDELYVSLLHSDSVKRSLDERFQLRQRLDVKTFEELRKELPEIVRVAAERKSGVITVEVDDKDPVFASELANGFVEELSRLLDRIAVSDAQQRRRFFEQQLTGKKEDLVKAEDDLRRLQEASGVIVLDKQAEALLGGAAALRAQIVEREIQLRVLRNTATEQNPDVRRAQAELQALRRELGRVESLSPGGRGDGFGELPVRLLPAAAVDYIRARREVKVQEALLESLMRQLEAARLDEAKEGPALQIVDEARPPDRRSRPKRGLIIAAAIAGGLLAGCSYVLAAGYRRWIWS
jgi:tyrosine-protein kinase Etk/Wzc